MPTVQELLKQEPSPILRKLADRCVTRNHVAELHVRGAKNPKIVGSIPYDSPSIDMGITEILKPGCFTKAIREAPKILSLWNHDASKPLGNTKSGTLVLKDSASALNVEIKPDPSISWAKDAILAVSRGDLNGISFGFTMPKDGSGEVYKNNVREIREVEVLYEVSPVTFPAYEGSSVALRNKRGIKMEYTMEYLNEIIEEMRSTTGAKLYELGDKYDQVAAVVLPDSPAFADVGLRGLNAFLSQSQGADRTQIDSTQENRSQVFKNFGEQLEQIIRAGHPDYKPDNRLFKVRAATGLSESVPSDGGFLLESQFSTEILNNVWNGNEILKRVRKFNLGDRTNSLKIPGIDETSRVDGSRQGGVRSHWTSEAAQLTASKPKFRQIELNLHKLIVLIYLTDELVEDVSALENFVTTAIQNELDFKIQDGIINGTGVGQPLGILNSGCMVSVAKTGGQAAATIIWDNVNSMWSRLLAPSRKNAIWLINQDCETQLHSMSLAVGTGGIPVYMPASGASAAPYSTLFGRPVVPIEQAQTLGTTGDIMLGDFNNGYVVITRGAARIESSIHLRFLYDEKVIRGIVRLDGQPVLAGAVTPYKGTDTLSHFVKLNTRD